MTDFIPFEEDLPILSPVHIIGGEIRIDVNPNLETDEVIVTFEAIALVPTEDGPQQGLLPILMEVATWDNLMINMKDNQSEEDNQ